MGTKVSKCCECANKEVDQFTQNTATWINCPKHFETPSHEQERDLLVRSVGPLNNLKMQHTVSGAIDEKSSTRDFELIEANIIDADSSIFLRTLSNLCIKVGTRTRFLVEIKSTSAVLIEWYHNDLEIREGGRFRIINYDNYYCIDVAPVTVPDIGTWTCKVKSIDGAIYTSSCYLNVLVPKTYKIPEFIEELRAVLTEQGTVSLECKVLGVPTPQLQWFKDGREIKAGDVFALTANPNDPTSLGTYTCEALNCMGKTYSSSKVRVIEKNNASQSASVEGAPIFSQELQDAIIKIGDTLLLICHVAVPPWPKNITWYNSNGRIEDEAVDGKYRQMADGLGGYMLEVVASEACDSAEWKCVATSASGVNAVSTCHIKMSIPKHYRKPRFMECLQAVLTEEGLVSFECKVVGSPTPLLTWFKDGHELKPGDVYQLTGTNSLGSYCCVATNCMGVATSTAELTIEDIQNQLNEEDMQQLVLKSKAPSFICGLKSSEGVINEGFIFSVQVTLPMPALAWYKDDQPIEELPNNTRYKTKSDKLIGTSQFDIINLESADQAEWKCVASNDFGHSITTCYLRLIIPKHFKKPRFLECLRASLSEEGAVNLECKVIGVPQPVLKWYKDGIELKPGDIHRITSGEDGTCCLGTYTCEAMNCMGAVSSSASLLGFEDQQKSRAEEQRIELTKVPSLSTIHEERTSQLYNTLQGDASPDYTMNDHEEISFSFDGKEVSLSLYETPDITEEEAIQILEMYAAQLSEHISEHNIVELPPMRFVKETSKSGNLLMEAILVDVSDDYFTSAKEDLCTEADADDIFSISEETFSNDDLPKRPPRKKNQQKDTKIETNPELESESNEYESAISSEKKESSSYQTTHEIGSDLKVNRIGHEKRDKIGETLFRDIQGEEGDGLFIDPIEQRAKIVELTQLEKEVSTQLKIILFDILTELFTIKDELLIESHKSVSENISLDLLNSIVLPIKDMQTFLLTLDYNEISDNNSIIEMIAPSIFDLHKTIIVAGKYIEEPTLIQKTCIHIFNQTQEKLLISLKLIENIATLEKEMLPVKSPGRQTPCKVIQEILITIHEFEIALNKMSFMLQNIDLIKAESANIDDKLLILAETSFDLQNKLESFKTLSELEPNYFYATLFEPIIHLNYELNAIEANDEALIALLDDSRNLIQTLKSNLNEVKQCEEIKKLDAFTNPLEQFIANLHKIQTFIEASKLDPGFIEAASKLDPGFIEAASKLDPGFIEASKLDPGFIEAASKLDPGFIEAASKLDPGFIEASKLDPGFIEAASKLDQDFIEASKLDPNFVDAGSQLILDDIFNAVIDGLDLINSNKSNKSNNQMTLEALEKLDDLYKNVSGIISKANTKQAILSLENLINPIKALNNILEEIPNQSLSDLLQNLTPALRMIGENVVIERDDALNNASNNASNNAINNASNNAFNNASKNVHKNALKNALNNTIRDLSEFVAQKINLIEATQAKERVEIFASLQTQLKQIEAFIVNKSELRNVDEHLNKLQEIVVLERNNLDISIEDLYNLQPINEILTNLLQIDASNDSELIEVLEILQMYTDLDESTTKYIIIAINAFAKCFSDTLNAINLEQIDWGNRLENVNKSAQILHNKIDLFATSKAQNAQKELDLIATNLNAFENIVSSSNIKDVAIIEVLEDVFENLIEFDSIFDINLDQIFDTLKQMDPNLHLPLKEVHDAITTIIRNDAIQEIYNELNKSVTDFLGVFAYEIDCGDAKNKFIKALANAIGPVKAVIGMESKAQKLSPNELEVIDAISSNLNALNAFILDEVGVKSRDVRNDLVKLNRKLIRISDDSDCNELIEAIIEVFIIASEAIEDLMEFEAKDKEICAENLSQIYVCVQEIATKISGNAFLAKAQNAKLQRSLHAIQISTNDFIGNSPKFEDFDTAFLQIIQEVFTNLNDYLGDKTICAKEVLEPLTKLEIAIQSTPPSSPLQALSEYIKPILMNVSALVDAVDNVEKNNFVANAFTKPMQKIMDEFDESKPNQIISKIDDCLIDIKTNSMHCLINLNADEDKYLKDVVENINAILLSKDLNMANLIEINDDNLKQSPLKNITHSFKEMHAIVTKLKPQACMENGKILLSSLAQIKDLLATKVDAKQADRMQMIAENLDDLTNNFLQIFEANQMTEQDSHLLFVMQDVFDDVIACVNAEACALTELLSNLEVNIEQLKLASNADSCIKANLLDVAATEILDLLYQKNIQEAKSVQICESITHTIKQFELAIHVGTNRLDEAQIEALEANVIALQAIELIFSESINSDEELCVNLIQNVLEVLNASIQNPDALIVAKNVNDDLKLALINIQTNSPIKESLQAHAKILTNLIKIMQSPSKLTKLDGMDEQLKYIPNANYVKAIETCVQNLQQNNVEEFIGGISEPLQNLEQFAQNCKIENLSSNDLLQLKQASICVLALSECVEKRANNLKLINEDFKETGANIEAIDSNIYEIVEAFMKIAKAIEAGSKIKEIVEPIMDIAEAIEADSKIKEIVEPIMDIAKAIEADTKINEIIEPTMDIAKDIVADSKLKEIVEPIMDIAKAIEADLKIKEIVEPTMDIAKAIEADSKIKEIVKPIMEIAKAIEADTKINEIIEPLEDTTSKFNLEAIANPLEDLLRFLPTIKAQRNGDLCLFEELEEPLFELHAKMQEHLHMHVSPDELQLLHKIGALFAKIVEISNSKLDAITIETYFEPLDALQNVIINICMRTVLNDGSKEPSIIANVIDSLENLTKAIISIKCMLQDKKYIISNLANIKNNLETCKDVLNGSYLKEIVDPINTFVHKLDSNPNNILHLELADEEIKEMQSSLECYIKNDTSYDSETMVFKSNVHNIISNIVATLKENQKKIDVETLVSVIKSINDLVLLFKTLQGQEKCNIAQTDQAIEPILDKKEILPKENISALDDEATIEEDVQSTDDVNMQSVKALEDEKVDESKMDQEDKAMKGEEADEAKLATSQIISSVEVNDAVIEVSIKEVTSFEDIVEELVESDVKESMDAAEALEELKMDQGYKAMKGEEAVEAKLASTQIISSVEVKEAAIEDTIKEIPSNEDIVKESVKSDINETMEGAEALEEYKMDQGYKAMKGEEEDKSELATSQTISSVEVKEGVIEDNINKISSNKDIVKESVESEIKHTMEGAEALNESKMDPEDKAMKGEEADEAKLASSQIITSVEVKEAIIEVGIKEVPSSKDVVNKSVESDIKESIEGAEALEESKMDQEDKAMKGEEVDEAELATSQITSTVEVKEAAIEDSVKEVPSNEDIVKQSVESDIKESMEGAAALDESKMDPEHKAMMGEVKDESNLVSSEIISSVEAKEAVIEDGINKIPSSEDTVKQSVETVIRESMEGTETLEESIIVEEHKAMKGQEADESELASSQIISSVEVKEAAIEDDIKEVSSNEDVVNQSVESVIKVTMEAAEALEESKLDEDHKAMKGEEAELATSQTTSSVEINEAAIEDGIKEIPSNADAIKQSMESDIKVTMEGAEALDESKMDPEHKAMIGEVTNESKLASSQIISSVEAKDAVIDDSINKIPINEDIIKQSVESDIKESMEGAEALDESKKDKEYKAIRGEEADESELATSQIIFSVEIQEANIIKEIPSNEDTVVKQSVESHIKETMEGVDPLEESEMDLVHKAKKEVADESMLASSQTTVESIEGADALEEAIKGEEACENKLDSSQIISSVEVKEAKIEDGIKEVPNIEYTVNKSVESVIDESMEGAEALEKSKIDPEHKAMKGEVADESELASTQIITSIEVIEARVEVPSTKITIHESEESEIKETMEAAEALDDLIDQEDQAIKGKEPDEIELASSQIISSVEVKEARIEDIIKEAPSNADIIKESVESDIKESMEAAQAMADSNQEHKAMKCEEVADESELGLTQIISTVEVNEAAVDDGNKEIVNKSVESDIKLLMEGAEPLDDSEMDQEHRAIKGEEADKTGLALTQTISVEVKEAIIEDIIKEVPSSEDVINKSIESDIKVSMETAETLEEFKMGHEHKAVKAEQADETEKLLTQNTTAVEVKEATNKDIIKEVPSNQNIVNQSVESNIKETMECVDSLEEYKMDLVHKGKKKEVADESILASNQTISTVEVKEAIIEDIIKEVSSNEDVVNKSVESDIKESMEGADLLEESKEDKKEKAIKAEQADETEKLPKQKTTAVEVKEATIEDIIKEVPSNEDVVNKSVESDIKETIEGAYAMADSKKEKMQKAIEAVQADETEKLPKQNTTAVEVKEATIEDIIKEVPSSKDVVNTSVESVIKESMEGAEALEEPKMHQEDKAMKGEVADDAELASSQIISTVEVKEAAIEDIIKEVPSNEDTVKQSVESDIKETMEAAEAPIEFKKDKKNKKQKSIKYEQADKKEKLPKQNTTAVEVKEVIIETSIKELPSSEDVIKKSVESDIKERMEGVEALEESNEDKKHKAIKADQADETEKLPKQNATVVKVKEAIIEDSIKEIPSNKDIVKQSVESDIKETIEGAEALDESEKDQIEEAIKIEQAEETEKLSKQNTTAVEVKDAIIEDSIKEITNNEDVVNKSVESDIKETIKGVEALEESKKDKKNKKQKAMKAEQANKTEKPTKQNTTVIEVKEATIEDNIKEIPSSKYIVNNSVESDIKETMESSKGMADSKKDIMEKAIKAEQAEEMEKLQKQNTTTVEVKDAIIEDIIKEEPSIKDVVKQSVESDIKESIEAAEAMEESKMDEEHKAIKGQEADESKLASSQIISSVDVKEPVIEGIVKEVLSNEDTVKQSIESEYKESMEAAKALDESEKDKKIKKQKAIKAEQADETKKLQKQNATGVEVKERIIEEITSNKNVINKSVESDIKESMEGAEALGDSKNGKKQKAIEAEQAEETEKLPKQNTTAEVTSNEDVVNQSVESDIKESMEAATALDDYKKDKRNKKQKAIKAEQAEETEKLPKQNTSAVEVKEAIVEDIMTKIPSSKEVVNKSVESDIKESMEGAEALEESKEVKKQKAIEAEQAVETEKLPKQNTTAVEAKEATIEDIIKEVPSNEDVVNKSVVSDIKESMEGVEALEESKEVKKQKAIKAEQADETEKLPKQNTTAVEVKEAIIENIIKEVPSSKYVVNKSVESDIKETMEAAEALEESKEVKKQKAIKAEQAVETELLPKQNTTAIEVKEATIEDIIKEVPSNEDTVNKSVESDIKVTMEGAEALEESKEVKNQKAIKAVQAVETEKLPKQNTTAVEVKEATIEDIIKEVLSNQDIVNQSVESDIKETVDGAEALEDSKNNKKQKAIKAEQAEETVKLQKQNTTVVEVKEASIEDGNKEVPSNEDTFKQSLENDVNATIEVLEKSEIEVIKGETELASKTIAPLEEDNTQSIVNNQTQIKSNDGKLKANTDIEDNLAKKPKTTKKIKKINTETELIQSDIIAHDKLKANIYIEDNVAKKPIITETELIQLDVKETSQIDAATGDAAENNSNMYSAQINLHTEFDSENRNNVAFSQSDDNKSDPRNERRGRSHIRDNGNHLEAHQASIHKASMIGNKQQIFGTFLTNKTSTSGCRIKLTCSIVSEGEITIDWFKNGLPLHVNSNYQTTCIDGIVSLEILNTSGFDTAQYTCRIKNEHGFQTSSADVKIFDCIDGANVAKDLLFTRQIKEECVGNALTLQCRIRANLCPSITWYKDGKCIGLDAKFVASYAAGGICKLSIKDPSVADSGLYSCRGENISSSDQISHHLYITNNYQSPTNPVTDSRGPILNNILTDNYVPAGGLLALQVEIKGKPTEINWYKDKSSLPMASEKHRTFEESGVYTLLYPNVNKSDVGNYTFSAKNSYGKVETSAYVNIIDPALIANGKPSMFLSRPDILFSVAKGEDITVSFRLSGDPKPKVTWMKGLKDITNSYRSLKFTSDDYIRFTLKRATENDFGTYCILAKNRFGCDRAFFTVRLRKRSISEVSIREKAADILNDIPSYVERQYIQDVPGPIPEPPIVSNTGSNWISLSWSKPEQRGAAPVTSYKIEAWERGGETRWLELGTTPITSFDAFKLKPKTEYQFRITPRNRYGWGESLKTENITVGCHVQLPEFVQILPGHVKALLSGSVVLECEVRGESSSQIIWNKNGTKISTNKRIKIEYSNSICRLMIHGLDESDAGKYCCEAINKIGRVVTFTHVSIVSNPKLLIADNDLKLGLLKNIDIPPQFTMRPRDRRIKMSYPIRLTCQISGSPNPEVSWNKNGTPITIIEGRYTYWCEDNFHTLELFKTALEDSGVYGVTAKNKYGSVSCHCTLIVDKGLRDYVAPEFKGNVSPPMISMQEGDELRIIAQVEAYPKVDIVWYRDHMRLRLSRKIVSTISHDGRIELSVGSVSQKDAGIYICKAINEIGLAEVCTRVEVRPKKAISIEAAADETVSNISQKPTFLKKPINTVANEGDDVVILCEVIGFPKPDVVWLRDFLKPEYYRDAACFHRLDDGPIYCLEIPQVKLDFTGTYTVYAKNCHGDAKSIISLQIKTKDIFQNEGSGFSTRRVGNSQNMPCIFSKLKNIRCCDGDSVSLECKIETALDPPNIKWTKSGKLIHLGGDVISEFDGTTAKLFIARIFPEDEGEYTCIAYNALGATSSSACIIVDNHEDRNICLTEAKCVDEINGEEMPLKSAQIPQIKARSVEPLITRIIPRSKPMPPKFYAIPHNRIAEEGDTVRFQCSVIGHPEPWTRWDKNNQIVTSSARVTIKERDDLRMLEISGVCVEDAGNYRVCVENESGRIEAIAKLEVIRHNLAVDEASYTRRQFGRSTHKQRKNTRSSSVPYAPKYLENSTSRNVNDNDKKIDDIIILDELPVVKEVIEGQFANLALQIIVDNSYDVIWIKDGCVLSNCANFQQNDDGNGNISLHIKHATPEDAGHYRCEIYNQFGDKFSKCNLIVKV